MASVEVCQPEHAYYCFDVLRAKLTHDKPMEAPFDDAKYPLFVTWNTKSTRVGGKSRLRGCIGNFNPMGLVDGLAEYALISALQDHRFNPITEGELSKLECEVSLLTDFEEVPTYLDWDIGTHGIYITVAVPVTSYTSIFSTSSSRRQRVLNATYLPDVIPAQGWTKVEAVESALRKAGYEGVIDETILESVKLKRYQSRHVTVSWEEYLEWKETRSDS